MMVHCAVVYKVSETIPTVGTFTVTVRSVMSQSIVSR